ncbi:MAG: helix-turn-helix transcriptional regulator [Clostridia bacterium]|nr:helix-turn-helix transcriptional regulator [Clostridia bacterium]
MFSEDFYLDIEKIHIAHEFILDRVHRCEYPYGRSHYGLVYVLNGKAEYRFFAGDRITITDGDILFLSPNCAYSIVTEKEFKHYTVNFDIHEDSSNLNALGQPYCLLQGKKLEQIERTLKELVGAWSLKKAGYEMRSTGYLYELLSQFYFEFMVEQNSMFYQRLLPAKEYIEQHFKYPVTLEQLAFVCNMSVTNFRREWKKIYSQAPMQYRDSIRLYYAKEYLKSGYYTITEVAKRCGFDDVSYFVRFFKQRTGVTPGDFKKIF